MKTNTIANLATFLLYALMVIAGLIVIGCDEGMNMVKPVMSDAPEMPTQSTNMVGEVKQPDETEQPGEEEQPGETEVPPKEPTPPADTTPPTVVEIVWYHDEALTEPVTDAVKSGNTVYAKVVFSELVQHVVADDESARPALFVAAGDTEVRFRIAARDADLQSGDAKPLGDSTDVYILAYTIPEGPAFTSATLQVGGATVDEAGNPVAGASARLEVASSVVAIEQDPPDTTPPTVVELGWYRDAQLTEAIVRDPDHRKSMVARSGDTVYAKAVFSEPMRYIVADDESARPVLLVVTRDTEVRYRIVARDADLRSGDVKPLGDGTDAFVLAYTVPEGPAFAFLRVGKTTVDRAGNPVAGLSELAAVSLTIEPEDDLPTRWEIRREWEDRKTALTLIPGFWGLTFDEQVQLIDEAFHEVFGFTYDFAKWLVFNIYLDERPEDRVLLAIRWQAQDIAVEYRYLQIHNPEATEEELLELLRESIRAGEVTID